MMDEVKELKPDEFTYELAMPIFHDVTKRTGMTHRENPKWFFPNFRALMGAGIFRVWHAPGSMLGAQIAPDIFNGRTQASILFWHAIEGTKNATQVFEAFLSAAKRANVENIFTSAYAANGGVKYKAMKRFLRMRGFAEHETIFSKAP